MIDSIPIQVTIGSSVALGDSSGVTVQATEGLNFMSALNLAMSSVSALQVEPPMEALEQNLPERPKADSAEYFAAMPLAGAMLFQAMFVPTAGLESSEMTVREPASAATVSEIQSDGKPMPQVVWQTRGFSSSADVSGPDSELLLDAFLGPGASDGGELPVAEAKTPSASHSIRATADQITADLSAPVLSEAESQTPTTLRDRELGRHSDQTNDAGLRLEVVDANANKDQPVRDAGDNAELLRSFVKEIALKVEHAEQSESSVVTDSSSKADSAVDSSPTITAPHFGQALEAEHSDGLQIERKQMADVPLHRQVIEQVVKEVRLHRLPERSDLVVRLNPPELGTLRVHITQDANGVYSQIQANNEQVKNLLQAHLPMLTSALADAGLRIDSVSVTSDAAFNTFLQSPAHENGRQEWQGQRNRSAYHGVIGIQSTGDLTSGVSADLSAYDWLV